MQKGLLSDHFIGVAVKKLSSVETTPATSNQHEFNGSAVLRALLGDDDRKNIPTRFIWLGAEQEGIGLDSMMSWYDARRSHSARTEYRLYYPTNEVTKLMEAGDTLFLAMQPDGTGIVIITPSESTVQNQLLWLFGLENQPDLNFESRAIGGTRDSELDFAARYILDELGIELEEQGANQLDSLIDSFGLKFPTTREFSRLAQDSLPEISPASDDPDHVLMAWLDREEMLFRRLERRIVSERLSSGFMEHGAADVDGFIQFSLSVQNRRKSRAGQSLENHLERIFIERSIPHVRGAQTERRHKPDFLFPSTEAYTDDAFPHSELFMLGAKSTLKDRWRQVLTEAERIKTKHLLTLEPAISEQQTEQMQQASLQLVIPSKLHSSYRTSQREWLLTLAQFLRIVSSQ